MPHEQPLVFPYALAEQARTFHEVAPRFDLLEGDIVVLDRQYAPNSS
ncbi:MAG: hypothetical protein U5K56_10225 [Halioglobus sp.]|nr:hypothetical protein [Halioglobus sp.]